MKKKIVSLLLLSVYFFGGWGISFVQAAGDIPSQSNAPAGTKEWYDNKKSSFTPEQQAVIDKLYGGNPNTVTSDGKCGVQCRAILDAKATTQTLSPTTATTANNQTVGASNGNNNPECFDGDCVYADDSNNMTSTSFTLNSSDLTPSEKAKDYKGGTKENLTKLLQNIGKYLLIATTTIAVLSIVVGGLMISTTGTSDRAAKGKTIIMLNIAAIVVALFSYSIIQLVSWIIA